MLVSYPTICHVLQNRVFRSPLRYTYNCSQFCNLFCAKSSQIKIVFLIVIQYSIMEHSLQVKIRKAARVTGRTLIFRNACVDDAQFILSLRTDTEKSRYLSSVPGDVHSQINWLKHYEQSNDQAYFIIQYQEESIGTVRLYDPQGDSFCWGSWILHKNRPSHAAMESSLMVYAYAIDHLGFKSAHFDVRKGNGRVLQFHERFGARRTGETESDIFYRLDGNAISEARKHYQRFLDESVQVEFL
jgi:RimJ/RimL family protein N-acetyltransferase